ncbi:uncharacterized protein LOC143293481 [Babylonia areolata]|uniref:uncharacterized protein LOC143293481 n=1 Tax=Babylonia areolata TaxID=304850 RepID=UPI003FD6A620
MSQQGTPSSQTASGIQGSSSPPLNRYVFLDDVDIGEQVKIQARLSRSLESAYDLAIKEAIRRSLLDDSGNQSSQTDAAGSGGGSNTTPEQTPASGAITAAADMNRAPSLMDDNDGDVLIQRGAAAAPAVRALVKNVGSSNSKTYDSSTITVEADSDTRNGMPDISAIDINDADDEDDDVPRSRRGRYKCQQQNQSERRPSLDRIASQTSERRPSLDRIVNQQSERRPSLDRMIGNQSERRPSPEMPDSYRSERRPSLERLEGHRSERRPSLEQINHFRSERRPSLDQINDSRSERRPSLDRIQGRQSSEQRDTPLSERRPSLELFSSNMSERRPSLEQLNDARSERRPSLDRLERRQSLERRDSRQSERRPSLERVSQKERQDRVQSAEECLQTISNLDTSNGTSQGINTLRPWPLSELGIPTNWDVTQLPDDGNDLYRMVALSPVDREYSAITVDFEEAGLKVINVERLQNTMLLERFNTEKEHLLKLRPPDFELNEKYLYHGTQANKHNLCEEGLDHRLSFQGCFGRGIYFSDNPRKCMQYAATTTSSPDTHPMILVCRVLLGESKVYEHGIKDSNLKREPEKPRAKGGWRYYDSVQGIPVDYPEYVVYDNRRSMIEYIVTFEEVSYRAPPAVSNFYMTPPPSLYKVEPIVLPIPEEELDKMYMLCPDTDSDGSCDEHTREVERLRDNVKRAKAKRLGIPYRPPTKEEKRYERLHWKRVCYYSCPPGSPLFEMMIIKKKQEKEERRKRKAEEKAKKAAEDGTGAVPSAEDEVLGAVGGSSGTASASIGSSSVGSSTTSRASRDTVTGRGAEPEFDVENDSVAEVLSTLIAEFLNVTTTDDVAKARRYILDNNMDMDRALCSFFRDLE